MTAREPRRNVVPGSDLPWIGAPGGRALEAAGITRLDQLSALRERDLLRIHGVGPKAVRILRSALEERGLAFLP